MENLIEKKLNEAGYRMLGDNESIEQFILNILNTRNARYLKAIPFLFYKFQPDTYKINLLSKNKNLDKLFDAILSITTKLSFELGLKGNLPENTGTSIKMLDKIILSAGLNYNEFKDEFELQLRNYNNHSPFINKQKIYAERDLQMNLSQLFTKKEKQIIRRLLEEKPISKTDYEYYSRKTKKKLNSIIGLQDFAKSLYAKTPKYDEELYHLKKILEAWIEKDLKIKEILIINFSLWDHDKIFITYKKKDDRYLEDQLSNTTIKMSKIKDSEILNLLNRYKKHNFG